MKNLILFKKLNRGFSLVEVVVSMTLILVISLSALTACVAFSTVIKNSKKTATIISYSQTSVNCINNAINQSDFYINFETLVNFCFGESVVLSKSITTDDQTDYQTYEQSNGITYKLTFDCGYIQILFTQTQNKIQAQVNGYTLQTNNAVYNYSRSYNFA